MKTTLEMTVMMIPTVPRMIIIGGEWDKKTAIKISKKDNAQKSK